MTSKKRLDVLLVDRGLAESREQAQRLIRAGLVTIDGRLSDKPGVAIDAAADVAVAGPASRFVSRGGEKLQSALDRFGISLANRICLDLGASTGGFTDCLLQAGAAKVYAVDVGRAQLHEKLRADPRVVVLESVNARNLGPQHVSDPIEFLSADVSFISLLKVIPAARPLLTQGSTVIVLVKPQFEAGPKHVRKGGVVTDPAIHVQVLRQVIEGLSGCDLVFQGLAPSPLKGPAGNREYLLWLASDAEPGTTAMDSPIDAAVEEAFRA